MINFSVTFKPGIPIYEQVIFAVKKAFVTGQLKPGDVFPSVRELSRELQINPNTAQKIVAHLVREKLLVIQPGIGSLVAEQATVSEEDRQDLLVSEIDRLVVEAKRLKIRKSELIKAVETQWQKNEDMAS
jgi:GntR family transcriptional regulator